MDGGGDGSYGFQRSEAKHEGVVLRDEKKRFERRLLGKNCLNGGDK